MHVLILGQFLGISFYAKDSIRLLVIFKEIADPDLFGLKQHL